MVLKILSFIEKKKIINLWEFWIRNNPYMFFVIPVPWPNKRLTLNILLQFLICENSYFEIYDWVVLLET